MQGRWLAVTFVRSVVRSLLGLLAPSSCSACGEALEAGGFGEEPAVFCDACGLPLPPSALDIDGVPVVAAGDYAPPLSLAIKRFKFDGHPELARPLSSLLEPAARGLGLGKKDVWVPVPLHRARLVERGYNHAALLARALAKRTRSEARPLLLERLRDTSQQARLDRDARVENTVGAFALRGPLSGRRAVLVDDVVTTGATVRACLTAFREGGIEVVAVVALAHASGRSC
jgi:ComF family protein